MNEMLKIIKKIRKHYFKWKITQTAERVGRNLTVNRSSSVSKKTVIKENVNFNGLRIRGGGRVVIGNNFHSGPDILILTRIHNYEGKSIPYDNNYIYKDVTIEDNVWLGTKVVILPGVTIGEGAIIQAGSVVVNSIPKYAIAGGHPAKVFKYRNIEHYESLKKQKKFH